MFELSSTAPPAHQAVDRALSVLTFLGQHPSGAALLEISVGTGIPKPSLHRILTSMRARGYAVQVESGGDYLLGPAALEAAFSFHAGLDLRRLLHPLATEICQRFRQTCHVATLAGPEVVYVDKIETGIGIRLTSVIGGRNPAHATGVGKALLARLLPDDAAVHAWVAEHGPLSPRTGNTVTSADGLAQALATVRDVGWAVDDEESEPGLLCVAAAIPLVFGALAPLTAVSVTGLRDQLLATGTQRLGSELLQTIDGFEFGAGHRHEDASEDR